MLTVGQDDSLLTEINGGNNIRAVAFAANGEYLVSGGQGDVRVWRVADGEQMAIVGGTEDVRCFAVSNDGRWIAAGTLWGEAFVWDAHTFEKVFSCEDGRSIFGVDFSPDSSRLVSANNQMATIWDIATRERVRRLRHWDLVRAAKYSPHGDRIVTATRDCVKVWDTNDGRSLKRISVVVTPRFNTGLLWSNNHLFVISDSKIKQFEAFTRSAFSEVPVPESNHFSSIALPKHGEFIAYSTNDTVTFSDTVTHTHIGLIQHPQDIRSITISPDDRFLAVGGGDGKITINSLSRIAVRILSLGCGAYEQLSYSDHSSIGFDPFVKPTPHIPGTRHSDRRHCAQLLEAQSTRERRGIIDCNNPRFSESNSPCTR